MSIPTASVSVAKHHLHQALDEAGLDDFLERRHHAGVVGGDARLQLGRGTGRSREHREISGVDPARRASTISRIRSRSSPVVNRTPRRWPVRAASSHWLRLKRK